MTIETQNIILLHLTLLAQTIIQMSARVIPENIEKVGGWRISIYQMSGLEKNLIPYGLYIGIRSNLKGLNLIGLKRKGLDNNKIKKLNFFIENIFDKKESIENNIININDEIKSIEEVVEIIKFIEQSTQRGLATL